MNITRISLRKILNCAGKETVEAHVYAGSIFGSASSPAGTSVGKHEAVFAPAPMERLIQNASKKVIPAIVGFEVTDQEGIDETLHETDGTKNFSKIGGAISTAISLAAAKAGAAAENKPLFKYINEKKKYKIPMQLGKVIGGGRHAGPGGPEFQEFLAAPVTCSIAECAAINRMLHTVVGSVLSKTLPGFTRRLDFEGGWVAPISNEFALHILSEAADEMGSKKDIEIKLGVDCAASSFYKNKTYNYDKKKLDAENQLKYVSDLAAGAKLHYIEDPFQEDDFKTFSKLAKKTPSLVCGDDLVTTNLERLKKAVKAKSCKAIIIKPNQVGTLSDSCEVIKFAQKKEIIPVVSHRSGDTRDASISHLAVAFDVPLVKVGIVGAERESKINELIEIEKYMAR